MNNSNEIDFRSLDLTTRYMPRPRLDSIFDRAADCKLIYVIASAGYGKTQAVHHYIEQHDASALWMQLTDGDNIGSRHWESFTHTFSIFNPELADKLREIGFPETLSRFNQFAEILTNMKRPSHKMFFVLDDFHLIHSETALAFAERCVYVKVPNVCIVIISRREPDINIVPLISKSKVGIITEDELRFTAAEAAEFFRRQAIPFSQQNLSQTMEATKGWPLAINMLSLIMKKTPNNFKYALNAMMQNIFKFLEIEAWGDFSKNIQKSLVKLSLLSDLPAVPLQELSGEAVFQTEILQNTPGLASFIWYGSLTNDLKIHPLYLEFLQGKHCILSDEEKRETYQRAARWCIENDFYIDAMGFYAKLGQFDHMIEMLLSYPFKLPRDTSEYFLNIIERLSTDNEEQIRPDLLVLKNLFIPLLLVGAGRYEEAKNRSLAVIKEWEHADNPLAAVFLYTSYSSLTYIDTYICTFTHEYNAPRYIKKSMEYLNLSSMPPAKVTAVFTNADVRSFACLVGEGASLNELDDFLEASRQVALYVKETPNSIYAGYEDLLACEYAFYKNQPGLAKKYAHSAIMKAREKKQYNIEVMAESYLLRLAVLDGDSSLVKEILKHMKSHLNNTDFQNRQLYHDLYIGAFYALIGLPEMVPYWLVMDEKEALSEIRIPTRELIVSALYYISSKKYQQALTILCNSYPREPYERFFFGELKLLLLMAIARLKTGDTQEAIANFEKAYRMSFDGVLEMFFIERGKELHLLVAAALKQTDCSIPKEWLKAIGRKASIYAKKAVVVTNALKIKGDTKEAIALSSRESEVLRDLYHGLYREEIAANQYLSINTVKKILQSIYIKLDAQNNVDAVRIALEKKLIE
jgi:LuxR family maltose regulon positive regulatory protein